MGEGIEWWQAALGLVLILVVLVVSVWQRLDLERPVAWATVRATVQLVLVGLLFTAIFESGHAPWYASAWCVVMVIVAGAVVARRSGEAPDRYWLGTVAIAITVGVVLLVIFGFGILDHEPVAVVVIAGITIGNTMPAVVQAVDRMRSQLREQAGQVEAMLALGFRGADATRPIVQQVIKLALVPQIERTRVVGLIALPGAMTGLLLAGVDPVDAVLVQLVVMFLVLGSMAVAVSFVALALGRRALTPDLRLADWARAVPEG